MKILIIDDEQGILFVVKKIFKRAGHEVIETNRGEEGLMIARKERPDLILLDLMMPRMGGWEVLEEMKTDARLKDIPVIILTLLSPVTEIVKGNQMEGVVGYILKPFTLNELSDRVRDIMQKLESLELVRTELIKVGGDVAEEYERVVKVKLLHKGLLEILQKNRGETKELLCYGMRTFEKVIAKENALVDECMTREKEIESLMDTCST